MLLSVPIAILNEQNRLANLTLLRDVEALAASQAQAFVALSLDLHRLGISIAGLFWGLWLFPMGCLVWLRESKTVR